jgi:hypothetical protein
MSHPHQHGRPAPPHAADAQPVSALPRRDVLAWSLACLPVLGLAATGCAHRPALSSTDAPGPRRRSRRRPHQAGPVEEALHAGDQPLLTETVGLLMQYAAERGDRPLYDAQLSRVQHHLRAPCGLLSWRATPDLGVTSPSSASIDDLTVVRALLRGAERWPGGVSEALATDIGAAVLEHEVVDGLLVDAASWNASGVVPSPSIQTSYLAVDVMAALADRDPEWATVYERSVGFLHAIETPRGLYPEVLPLPSAGAVVTMPVPDPDPVLNAILVLYCAVALAAVGRGGASTLSFLEAHWVDHGSLAGRYQLISGTPVPGFESVAVYGLAARLARYLGRAGLSDAWIDRMLAYQYLDPVIARPSGPLPHRQTSPFDNLQAMLALQQARDGRHP